MQTRIGIMGYGNLGRGIECAVKQNDDLELVAVFTRRPPETVKVLTEGVKVYRADDAIAHADEIDVLILCGGSATDLPGKPRNSHSILTWSTATIPTRRSRRTFPTSTPPRVKAATSR